jgi:hypothetical protein
MAYGMGNRKSESFHGLTHSGLSLWGHEDDWEGFRETECVLNGENLNRKLPWRVHGVSFHTSLPVGCLEFCLLFFCNGITLYPESFGGNGSILTRGGERETCNFVTDEPGGPKPQFNCKDRALKRDSSSFKSWFCYLSATGAWAVNSFFWTGS